MSFFYILLATTVDDMKTANSVMKNRKKCVMRNACNNFLASNEK